MATAHIVFFTYQGTNYEADLLAGTYMAIPPITAGVDTLRDRKHVLWSSGVHYCDWGQDSVNHPQQAVPIANPKAFGRFVGTV